MEIVNIAVEEIKEYENNAKLHPQEQINQIKKSIEKFGFNDPIAIDEDNVIIEGHGRFEAVKQLNFKEVPVIKLSHMTEEKKRAYILAHNKITMNSGFDKDLLENELQEILNLDLCDFDFDHFLIFDDIGSLNLEKRKHRNSTPIPFQGQKRNSVQKFTELIHKYYDDSYIFVDLFGGSGLLSYNVKQVFPKAEVYYNDFDGYVDKCRSVRTTNEILGKIAFIVQNVPKQKRIPQKAKRKILDLLLAYENDGVTVDYITLSSCLLFSGNYLLTHAEFAKSTFYNRVPSYRYDEDFVENFHDGLNVTCIDWKDNILKWKDNPKVVFIADPPYLGTNIDTYTNNDAWDYETFLGVNIELRELNHIFFTSNKSNLITLDKFMKSKYGEGFFQNEYIHSNVVSMGSDRSYTDYMVFSFKDKEE